MAALGAEFIQKCTNEGAVGAYDGRQKEAAWSSGGCVAGALRFGVSGVALLDAKRALLTKLVPEASRLS